MVLDDLQKTRAHGLAGVLHGICPMLLSWTVQQFDTNGLEGRRTYQNTDLTETPFQALVLGYSTNFSSFSPCN
jgi:hypothetical protein